MKILLLGLDCATPELLLGDPELRNVQTLMKSGIYGRMESVIPAITVPAWLSMVSSRDPGSLGLYGFRNRPDRGYGLTTVDSGSVRPATIAGQIASEGGRVIQVGVPPSYPPPRTNGVSVGCFLTPDDADVFTHPPEYSERIRSWIGGDYPVDVPDFRNRDRETLADDLTEMSRTQFSVLRRLLVEEEWDFAHYVDIGLDRVQHGYWKHFDRHHPDFVEDSPWRNVIRDYYRHLDEEIGRVLEVIDDDTAVMLASDHGAQSLLGGVCVNDWLRSEGWLVLKEEPTGPTELRPELVDWSRTRAWAYGGYYSRVFINLKHREPHGIVDPAEYHQVRSELALGFTRIRDDRGQKLNSWAIRPEEVYQEVNGVAPDLLLYFDELRWRAVGKVGMPSLLVRENDTGPDDCNHSHHGAFALAVPGIEPAGLVTGMKLLDVAPTLLTLGGYQVPTSMQGRSRVGIYTPEFAPREAVAAGDAPQSVLDRLSGLGYLE